MTVGLSSPLIGRLIDAFGPRRVILPGKTLFGCGVASLALLRFGLWQFYGSCFAIGRVGNGAAHLAFARSISTWFEKRLGTALAFVMVGAGLGAMILPVIAQAVVSRSGWLTFHSACLPYYRSVGGISSNLGQQQSNNPPWLLIQGSGGSKACGPFLLHHRRRSFREFDQYERRNYSHVRVVD